MFTVEVLNLITNKVFKKHFKSPYLMEDYVKKCKYSKKVIVLSWGEE